MPQLTDEQASDVIARRHPEFQEWQLAWRWLMDSYDGGQRYRNAVYGYDLRGMPLYNLVRHRREYPDPDDRSSLAANAAVYPAGLASGAGNPGAVGQGTPDASHDANDGDFGLRHARTPVPGFVREAVDIPLATIFEKEIVRDGPPPIQEWWLDVDGMGTDVDDWIEYVVAPVFMTLGQIDLCVDHPPAPDGEAVETRADLQRLNLDRCVASYVLPTNLYWWERMPDGRYSECLVREHTSDPETGKHVERFRFWDSEGSTLIGTDGVVLGYTPHGYGRVPIQRVFWRRRPAAENVGLSRVEGIAELQREYYNRDSELILSDTTQAHALIQGPEDYVQADGTIPIGPSWMLPMKKNSQGGTVTYQGFSVVDFPKGAADSIRKNLEMIRDEVDRASCLTKPAGAAGTTGTTVAQSGVSKQLDHVSGHKLATQICKALSRLEMVAVELVSAVLGGGNEPAKAVTDQVKIAYPSSFDLQGPAELAQGLLDFQGLLKTSGGCPETEVVWLKRLVRVNLPGEAKEEYEEMDTEIEAAVAAKAAARAAIINAKMSLLIPTVAAPDLNAPGGDVSAEEAASGRPDYNAYPDNAAFGGGWQMEAL